ncbi:ABC transporter ATP-binding protein [Phytomonospora sp. NPDC050363]|uniref:ABC transporter ATP-binding protein n=1 Tax=Phytomonospora sp. NPDC050363 TaxID=3155642 RepID=UPI0033F8CFBF
MRTLPSADPGTPDAKSPARYLWWLLRGQASRVLAGMFYGIVWMVCMAVSPALLGRAIDEGVATKHWPSLLAWSGGILVLAAVGAAAGIMRHRTVVMVSMFGAFRTVQVTTKRAVLLGAALPKQVSTGEVVSVGAADISNIGMALDISARLSGAVVTLVVIVTILLAISPPLGAVVLIGVPILMFLVGPLIKPLQRREAHYREQQGGLSAQANDIVSGLRVLRGIGGEELFSRRYAERSQELRRAGYRIGAVQTWVEALQILLPGLFLALVTWLSARMANSGAISVGDVVAIYGYAALLTIPLRTFAEAAYKVTRGLVAARRVVNILNLQPDVADESSTVDSKGGELVDPASGLAVPAGRLYAIAAAEPADATAIADRLGRYEDSGATFGDVPLSAMPVAEVRRRILVADNESRLFAGTLREELDVRGGNGDDVLERALRVAAAEDIVEALPGGLDGEVAEAGRSLSGGQRQRLRLARALVVDPEVLILVEPTSAVDAHTEAAIAERIGEARAGRTTIVATTSPLLLSKVDEVAYVDRGKVLATGPHHELLRTEPRYRATVTRGESED